MANSKAAEELRHELDTVRALFLDDLATEHGLSVRCISTVVILLSDALSAATSKNPKIYVTVDHIGRALDLLLAERSRIRNQESKT